MTGFLLWEKITFSIITRMALAGMLFMMTISAPMPASGLEASLLIHATQKTPFKTAPTMKQLGLAPLTAGDCVKLGCRAYDDASTAGCPRTLHGATVGHVMCKCGDAAPVCIDKSD